MLHNRELDQSKNRPSVLFFQFHKTHNPSECNYTIY